MKTLLLMLGLLLAVALALRLGYVNGYRTGYRAGVDYSIATVTAARARAELAKPAPTVLPLLPFADLGKAKP